MVQICVYHSLIEEHDNDTNLSYVIVTKDFTKQYFNEIQSEYFNSFNEFLDEYTADNTEDFYEYAIKHNAIIGIEHW